METLSELRTREADLAREWERLQDAMCKLDDGMAEPLDTQAFRQLREQAAVVDRGRTELKLRIAELEGLPR